jgi:NAD(P)-dependent dehydrogenase (short-subunit alcohol dehydrogenase family)
MIKNKVVIITGGAGFLGQEFVRAVVENNGIAIIADIDKNSATKIIYEISTITRNSNVFFYDIDITNKSSIKDLIKKVSEKFGKIDAWVNNAYPKNKKLGNDTKREYSNSFFEFQYDDFCESVSLNIGSYFLCSQQIAKYFIDQKHGNIINVSSVYGVIAPRFEIYDQTGMTMPVDYSVNKSSMIHFSKYLAKYLKGNNIRVNSLSPGGVFNNQPESFVKEYGELGMNKGMLTKEDINGALIFLLSDQSKYVNGQNLIVDDGWTL